MSRISANGNHQYATGWNVKNYRKSSTNFRTTRLTGVERIVTFYVTERSVTF